MIWQGPAEKRNDRHQVSGLWFTPFPLPIPDRGLGGASGCGRQGF